jgi:predicted permease
MVDTVDRGAPGPDRKAVGRCEAALANAARAFVTIGAVEVFWIATAWPNGTSAITFAAISVIIFAPKADAAAMPSAVILIILSVRYYVAEKESASSLRYTYPLSALGMTLTILLTG